MSASIHKLPAPPHRDSPVTHSSESHHIVRELSFPADTPITGILANLQADRVTGTLTLNISQGSVGTITFHAKQKIVAT